ncbi:NRAMP family divalent metal transporter [Clostridium sp. LBM24168]
MKNRGGLLLAFAIIGSGITAAAVLNDAGAVTVFSVLGSKYGYSIIWELAAVGIFLVIIQEMVSRMAVVTGKGLSDLVREKFGVKWTFAVMVVLLVANICSAAANFSGIALAAGVFNISKYISIPVIAIVICIMFTESNCKLMRRIFIAFQIALFTYIVLAFALKPDLGYITFKALNPKIEFDTAYFIMILAVIGSVAAPYMQFYMQSLLVDKSIPLKKYGYEKIAVYIGSIIAIIIDLFIIVGAFEILGKKSIYANSIINMYTIFTPLSNKPYIVYTAVIFAVSILACFIIPFCTAFSICQSFGFESEADNKIKDAPVFFGIFLFVVILGSLIALVSRSNFFNIIVTTQAVVGILSSVIFVFIIKIANDQEIMGNKVNGIFRSIAAYIFVLFTATALIITILLKLFN